MGVLYYRIYDGAKLMISTKNFEFARDFFLDAYDPSKGPYRFFVGGYMDDLRPFLPFEYPSIPK